MENPTYLDQLPEGTEIQVNWNPYPEIYGEHAIEQRTAIKTKSGAWEIEDEEYPASDVVWWVA